MEARIIYFHTINYICRAQLAMLFDSSMSKAAVKHRSLVHLTNVVLPTTCCTIFKVPPVTGDKNGQPAPNCHDLFHPHRPLEIRQISYRYVQQSQVLHEIEIPGRDFTLQLSSKRTQAAACFRHGYGCVGHRPRKQWYQRTRSTRTNCLRMAKGPQYTGMPLSTSVGGRKLSFFLELLHDLLIGSLFNSCAACRAA